MTAPMSVTACPMNASSLASSISAAAMRTSGRCFDHKSDARLPQQIQQMARVERVNGSSRSQFLVRIPISPVYATSERRSVHHRQPVPRTGSRSPGVRSNGDCSRWWPQGTRACCHDRTYRAPASSAPFPGRVLEPQGSRRQTAGSSDAHGDGPCRSWRRPAGPEEADATRSPGSSRGGFAGCPRSDSFSCPGGAHRAAPAWSSVV